ncbi:MAG: adenosylcobinamide-GDP ribazoletransferase [Bacteroides sp.]|nr:adenosylcobinamide-GDP ribazoletransferase [Eubacterium sp.]MCM1417856.1 adenosylcobinamide-GDP ribazoletransferase [Roseburia sp.]MCM1461295.1 adenosylcobinamide-GDP ribazoletransferase [Bacteroides sp.]
MILNSLFSAFLMYSRIPMPRVEWKEENRRYALCFFPLVGAVIGLLFVLWRYLCERLGVGDLLSGAVSAAIPLLVTGGIHMDGFCDVADARASFGDREKKLKIMDDPHIGSFAVMRLCIYLILEVALFAELKNAVAVAYGYVLSRSLSGLAAVTLRSAKSDGALRDFSKPAHKRITILVLSLTSALCAVLMLLRAGPVGGAAIAGAGLCFVYYRVSAYKEFGGVTGDLAGWFLQLCEIAILGFTVLGEKFSEVLHL